MKVKRKEITEWQTKIQTSQAGRREETNEACDIHYVCAKDSWPGIIIYFPVKFPEGRDVVWEWWKWWHGQDGSSTGRDF